TFFNNSIALALCSTRKGAIRFFSDSILLPCIVAFCYLSLPRREHFAPFGGKPITFNSVISTVRLFRYNKPFFFEFFEGPLDSPLRVKRKIFFLPLFGGESDILLPVND